MLRVHDILWESSQSTTMQNLLSYITKRNRAQRALQESEAKLKQAQVLANLGYWDRDLITDRITWSEGTLRIFGQPLHYGSVSQAGLERFIHPDDVQLQRGALRKALQGDRSYDVEYRIVRPEGNIRWVHVCDQVEYDTSGRPIRLFGTVQDITERKHAEERLRQYAARMEVLAGVSKALAECRLDVQAELETIAEQTVNVLGDGCVIALLSPNKKRFQAVAQHHRDAEASTLMESALRHVPIRDLAHSDVLEPPPQRAPFTDTECGWNATILKTGKGLLFPVVDPEEFKEGVHPALLPFLERIKVYSMLVVPLLLEGQVIGVLTLFRSKPGQPYTPDDQILLQDLADRAALLIRNAQLFLEVRVGRENLKVVSQQLLDVQEAERRSLARELHDGIGQMLTMVKLKLQAANLSTDIHRPRVQHAEIIDTVEEALDAVRNLSLDLRPAILDDLGLDSAIRWYLERQTHDLGIHANLISLPLEARPSPDVEVVCFRILQELWTNILRHAQAHNVSVELRETNEELVMTVTDDGKGFSVPEAEENASRGESMGLLNVRERAAHVGGIVDMFSTPGKGTTTNVRIPMYSAGRIS